MLSRSDRILVLAESQHLQDHTDLAANPGGDLASEWWDGKRGFKTARDPQGNTTLEQKGAQEESDTGLSRYIFFSFLSFLSSCMCVFVCRWVVWLSVPIKSPSSI